MAAADDEGELVLHNVAIGEFDVAGLLFKCLRPFYIIWLFSILVIFFSISYFISIYFPFLFYIFGSFIYHYTSSFFFFNYFQGRHYLCSDVALRFPSIFAPLTQSFSQLEYIYISPERKKELFKAGKALTL